MADIAFIFHWSVSDMQKMPLRELIDWHKKAIKRYDNANKVKS